MREGKGTVTSSMWIVSASPSQLSALGPIANVDASRRTLARPRSVIAQRFALAAVQRDVQRAVVQRVAARRDLPPPARQA